MRNLRLKNFRSLVDTGRIELRPLTILVGANGSGKSSFLRFFPLLRQTYEKSVTSPLLWYGRDLDFGDFSQVVRRTAEPEEIEVEFEIVLPPQQTRVAPGWSTPLPLRVKAVLEEREGNTHVRRSVLACHDDQCELEFGGRSGVASFRVNDLDIISASPFRRSAYELYGDNHLVPRIFPADATARNGSLKSVELRLRQALRTIAYPPAHGREDVTWMVNDIEYDAAQDLLESLQAREDLGKRWKRQMSRMTTESPEFLELKTLLFAHCIPHIMELANLTLEREAGEIVYIGPFRMSPSRSYPVQGLSVRSMDSRGENLAMFLRALSAEQMKTFSGFTKQHTGYNVHLRTEGTYPAILLEDDTGQSYNLVDMGYGFSQVLPVVTQCWAAASGFQPSERDPLPATIAIEQPELHLHPSHQARLADMLVGTIEASRSVAPELRFVIETHSEPLIIRLGELVESRKISTADVSVLLFEQDPESKATTIRESTYGPDGALVNWPYGFLAP